MVFKSKMDRWHRNFIIIMSITLPAVLLIIYLTDAYSPVISNYIMSVVFLLMIAYHLFSLLYIKYTLNDRYLLVQIGLWKVKIKYDSIYKVIETNKAFSGISLLNNHNAIEIFYEPSVFGSVKISPFEKERFIEELKRRCPQAIFQS